MAVNLKHPGLSGKTVADDVFPQSIKCFVGAGLLDVKRDANNDLGYSIFLNEKKLEVWEGSEQIIGLLLSAQTSVGPLLVMPRAGNPQKGIQFIAFDREEAEILDICWQ